MTDAETEVRRLSRDLEENRLLLVSMDTLYRESDFDLANDEQKQVWLLICEEKAMAQAENVRINQALIMATLRYAAGG